MTIISMPMQSNGHQASVSSDPEVEYDWEVLVSGGLDWSVSSTGTSLGYRYSSRRFGPRLRACWSMLNVARGEREFPADCERWASVARSSASSSPRSRMCTPYLFLFFSYLFCSFFCVCVCILARCYCIHFIVQFLSLYPLFILTFCCCAFLVFVVLLKEV